MGWGFQYCKNSFDLFLSVPNQQPNYKFYIDAEYSILWNRFFGQMFDTDKKYKELCSELDEVLKLFCQENSKCEEDTYVVIGHCPQVFDKLDGKKKFSYN